MYSTIYLFHFFINNILAGKALSTTCSRFCLL